MVYYINLNNKLNKFIMKANMGKTDRIIRVIIAVIFAVLYFTKTVEGTLAYILLALGAVFLLTSIVSFCPLYVPFGIKTCKKKD
ncbi:MAG: DUF2892 domain-containing protein [Vicingaceae bacterium]